MEIIEVKGGRLMEQLTQKELMNIKSQMDNNSLAIKKYQIYQSQVQDEELKNIFKEGEKLSQNHLQTLLNQLRDFNGKEH